LGDKIKAFYEIPAPKPAQALGVFGRTLCGLREMKPGKAAGRQIFGADRAENGCDAGKKRGDKSFGGGKGCFMEAGFPVRALLQGPAK
jgi:hypothetical protein